MKKITAAILSVMFCMTLSADVNVYSLKPDNFASNAKIKKSNTVSPNSKKTKPVLTASNIDSTTNKLIWTKIEGAESYFIYLFNEKKGKFEKYGEINGTSCRDKNLLPNTKYTYKVRAKFPDGSMGKMSESTSVYTRNKYGNSFYSMTRLIT